MATALAIEALDELIDGTKGAAFPVVRADLHLSYTQVGLLIAMPLLVGSLIELPLGLVAGYGRRRNRLVLTGGIAFAGALAVVGLAQSFWVLLIGMVAFFPAAGAFVSLTQAALMDAEPGKHQQHMAAWNLAGSAGAVAGPLLLASVLFAGGTWRTAYLLLAFAALATTAVAAFSGPARARISPERPAGLDEAGQDDDEDRRPTVAEALRAVRDPRVARWLVLLQVIDLLLDVLTGYVGIYLVDVARASPALAAVGVAIRLAAGLVGDAIWVAASSRLSGRKTLMATAAAACALYPAFLLLPGLGAKLAVLAALSVATACWYPVGQAELYGSLPGRSGVAVFALSAAGMAGAAGPLLVGLAAQRIGLSLAMVGLAITPVAVLAILPRCPGQRRLRSHTLSS
ncbi:MAG TPA: MFS transporter [Streptosporangiaceae bacterium]|nr:MFS transporter [Streptosporangiaceae bacterium]